MSSACEQLAARLPEAGRGERRTEAVSGHVAVCLRCRLELLRWERLFRSLGQLADERAELPPGLLADILATLEAAAKQSARRTVLTGRRLAYGIACLGAALTGVLVARGRASSEVAATNVLQG